MKLIPKAIITLSIVFFVIAFAKCHKGQPEPDSSHKRMEYTSVSQINGIYKIDTNIAISIGTKEKMLALLEKETLHEKKTINEIPDFIKTFLGNLSPNKTMDMANPNEAWLEGGRISGFDTERKAIPDATTSIANPFPSRQLVYFGIGKNAALISYFAGGIQKTQHAIILKFQNNKIVDLWFDNYPSQFDWLGDNTGIIATKAGIIKYIKEMNNGNC
ncbi:MAG: hypothetical protein HY062_18400 [Bacteroidetes bacterium]|nr:hypothetical protein [Bacteroidota bacterium]